MPVSQDSTPTESDPGESDPGETGGRPVHVIELYPSRYNPIHPDRLAAEGAGKWVDPPSMLDFDTHDSPNVLAIPNRFQGAYARYAIGYTGPHGVARRVHGGPLLAGPYPYLVALASVIDNHGGTGAERARGLAAGTEVDAQVGDLVMVDGLLYRITERAHGDPELVPVTTPAPGPVPAP